MPVAGVHRLEAMLQMHGQATAQIVGGDAQLVVHSVAGEIREIKKAGEAEDLVPAQQTSPHPTGRRPAITASTGRPGSDSGGA